MFIKDSFLYSLYLDFDMKNLNLPKGPRYDVPASILKRFLAFIIDMLLLDIIVSSAFIKYFESLLNKGLEYNSMVNYLTNNPIFFKKLYFMFLIIGLLYLLYFLFMQMNFKKTIGMKIMNLKIITTDKKEFDFIKASLRNLFVIPIFPIIILWLIDPIYLFWKNQRLSEMISKTLVVEDL